MQEVIANSALVQLLCIIHYISFFTLIQEFALILVYVGGSVYFFYKSFYELFFAAKFNT